jgi:iron complex outermembrane receptor protein
LLALLVSSTSLAQTAPVHAADTAAEGAPGSLEEVVVTGSSVKLTAAESTATVQVLSTTDITRLGVTSVAELLSSLTQANSNNTSSDISGSDSFASGASSIGLRGLGEQSTLVLLNGRRVAPNALADYNLVFTNVDAFPLDAIDHVEILPEGASAVYGSDAVAGVINIITKHNFQGLEVRANRQQSLLGDKFPTTTAALTAGIGNDASDGYNVMLNVNYFDRASVMWTDYLGEVNGHMTQVSPLYGTPSSYTPYGNFIDTSTGATQPGSGCPAADDVDDLCRYNRYERFQAVPQSRRLQAYLSGDLNLGDRLNGFFEGTYSQDNTEYINAFPTYGAALPQILLRNGQNFYYMELNPQSPLNPFGSLGDDAEFRYRFTDAPNQETSQNSQFRVLTGLKGDWGGANWETAIGYMGSREASLQEGAYSASAFQKYIGCPLITCATIDPFAQDNGTVSTDPNFFNQPGGYHPGAVNSPAVLNALFPEQGYVGKYSQSFMDAKVSGTLFTSSAGAAQYAAGLELRHEDFDIAPTANLIAGDIVGFGVSSVDSARTFGAAFGELNIPITRDFLIDGALRLDKYQGFETHVSPKIGFNWKILETLRLRGNWSGGFRAPNLVESANAPKVSYAPGAADPARCPAASALINALLNKFNTLPPGSALGASILARVDNVFNNECNNSLFTDTNGNPNLKPETSKTWAVGLVWEISHNTSATLDWWNIHRDDYISQLSASQIVDFALAGQPLPPGTSASRRPFNPASDPSFTTNDTQLGGINDFTTFGVPALGQLQGTNTQFENLFSQKASGLDLAFKGRFPLTRTWLLDANLNGTYNLSYHDSSITNFSENLSGQYFFPKLVANATLGIVHAAWDTGFRLNYTGGYALQEGSVDTEWTLAGCAQQGFTTLQCHVASNVTVDYFLTYQPKDNLTVTFNMLNIAATKAPADLKGFGGAAGVIPPTTAIQDVEGRVLKLGITYKIF